MIVSDGYGSAGGVDELFGMLADQSSALKQLALKERKIGFEERNDERTKRKIRRFLKEGIL